MKKTLSVVISSTLLLNGCSTLQPMRQTVSDTFASEDPCSNNARNIGVAAGAVVGTGLGVLISKATGGDSKKAILTGAALGAGAAAATGWFVGKNIDQRRCELHKIAERYHIRLHATPIEAAGQSEPIGLAITLPEETQSGHFASGSDIITASARKYFTEIARQYSLSVQLANLKPDATDNEKQALRKQLTDKKILLVGHTDDSGDSANNAELSERRARAVATLFREVGVPDGNLLYQGAGETLPIADNNSVDGRQANRRVEIIDVNDETALQTYLAGRRPNLAFYRVAAESPAGDSAKRSSKATPAPAPAATAAASETRAAARTRHKASSVPPVAATTSTPPVVSIPPAPVKKPAIITSSSSASRADAQAPLIVSKRTPKPAIVSSSTAATRSGVVTTTVPAIKPVVVATPAAVKIPAPAAPAATPATPAKSASVVAASTPAKPQAAANVAPVPESINFGGKPATDSNATLSVGKQVSNSGGFSLISKAYASELVILHSCNRDRPRVSGSVRQLKDGKVYAKSEHLPGLYGTSWVDKVNGHLVVLNRVSLLRDSGQADVLPQVNIYKDYDPQRDKNQRPTLSFTPQVNTYRGDKGILYRMFAGSGKNLQCMDVLLPLNGGREAQSGLIMYDNRGTTLIAPFQPKSL